MLVMLSAALAFEATSDLVMGSAPQTSVSLRQAEGLWYSGTRYHFTRLTAELSPRTSRLVEPGLKVRGSMYAVGVPSEDAFLLSPGNPGLELWLTVRPSENALLAVFVGVTPVYLGATPAFHVLPHETDSMGGLAGLHLARRRASVELQQTFMGQVGPWDPAFGMSQSALAWHATDQLVLMGTGTVSSLGHRVGLMTRWSPRSKVSVALGLDLPFAALGEEDTVPVDVVVELRVQRPRQEGSAPREMPLGMWEGFKESLQGR